MVSSQPLWNTIPALHPTKTVKFGTKQIIVNVFRQLVSRRVELSITCIELSLTWRTARRLRIIRLLCE